MHQSVCFSVSSPLVMIARNKMKIVILSIALCAILAIDAVPDGSNIYGSNQVQYSHPQPTNYHYPQPHYGSQQSYSTGIHPAQQPQQQHGPNQFSEQYLVTAIKHDPAPPVAQYQPPSYKPENPFNGQSYIIEPSYVLKPYRPETTYHAQPYRPHNPAPYPPSYHPPAYPAYQVPPYPAPFQSLAYQPYPAPVYQNQGPGSSAILVYSTPLLAGYSGISVEPTQTYASVQSAVSSSQVQPEVQTVVVESVTVKWSDILSADANELGQTYKDKEKIGKESAKESEEEDDDEKQSTQESDSKAKKQDNNEGSQEQSSSENVTPSISYPIPANLTSKAVWKIPKTVASYVQSASGTGPDSSVESLDDKSGDAPIQKNNGYSKESKGNEESSSKSSLTDNNQVGTENKESSETATADQVTKISLQGALAENEGRTYPTAVTSSSETLEDNNESGVVAELVTQVPFPPEKPKSGSSVYYEQGPTNAGQEVVETAKTNEESKESSSLYEPVAEISRPANSVGVDSDEEAGTETTPVINQVDELVSQILNYEAAIYQSPPNLESFYAANESAHKSDVAIQVSQTPGKEEVSQYAQPIYQQGSELPKYKPLDESDETTDAAAIEVSSERVDPLYVVKTESPLPIDRDESKELPSAVTPEIPVQTERPAYLAPYKPVVPKIFRPKVESEEIEPPETDFGERIKAFTKFALAVQKATHQGIHQQQPVQASEPISWTPSAPLTNGQQVTESSKSESVSTQETSSENYTPNVNEELLKIRQPVNEYPTEVPPTYEASLFYRKPVAPELNKVPTVEPYTNSQPTVPVDSLQEQEFSTEAPFKFNPIFYAQAAEKFPPPSAETTEAPEPIKYEEPTLVQNAGYGGRIVAEKMSSDQPVQVINAFHQFVYTAPSIATAPPVVSDQVSVVQLPLLDRDPMEKTENYATQRIYTASAEIPGDYVASSTPLSYISEQNPSTYAFIEEAGLSAEYQKEIAAAEKKAESIAQKTSEEAHDNQTEIPNISQEVVYSTEPAIVNKNPSYEENVKVKSTEDISSEISYAPVTDSYQGKTQSLSYEAEAVSTIKAKSAEEVGSSEVTDAPVTDSSYQESYKKVTTPQIKKADEVSAEIVYASVTESVYQEKVPAYEDVIPAKAKSEEDVSSEAIAPVTDEATEYPDVSLTRHQTPAITQELNPAVALHYEIYSSTSEPESATIVVGTMLQVGDSSSESNEKTQPEDVLTKSNAPSRNAYGSLPITEYPLPCHTDKSVSHFPKFLFNPSSLANIPLDSVESSGEDAATISPTTVLPDLTAPTATYNDSTSAETSTVASDGYKYVFKSRPTPNRFYESRSTTSTPSTNTTTNEPPTSRRPFVVIGKPIEMRKPINGRIYSRPSSIPQRKPQTLAQIKILPTRLRSSSSTIQLPNRRFFIGRTLMANDKNNHESKEDETKKDA